MYAETLSGFFFITVILAIVALIAWLMAISRLIDAAKMKGHHTEGTGVLWFIGIFATPIVLGLYTASLPDKTRVSGKAEPSPEVDLCHDLPAV